jgi:phospholipid/cholesterol/gamma-HCH transport system ATP-binding protein
VLAVGPSRDVLRVNHPFIKQFFLGGRGQRALEVLDERDDAAEEEPKE